MKNLWNKNDASLFDGDDLSLRVYSSRLLGKSTELVLHGGGNTSCKGTYVDIFGEKRDIICQRKRLGFNFD